MQEGVGLLVSDVMPIYMIISRYFITMLNFVNCSTVIRSPTVKYLCSWEKPLVKPMAPGSIFHHINLPTTSYFWRHFYFAFFTLHLYHKNTKNIILSYLSDLTLVSDREGIDNPFIALVARIYLFVQVRGTRAWPPTGLIPWFSKTEGNTYATLLHHPFLVGENQRSAQEVARMISGTVAGDVYAKVNIPSTHHIPLSPALHYLPFASRFPLLHFTLAVLLALSFPFASFRSSFFRYV